MPKCGKAVELVSKNFKNVVVKKTIKKTKRKYVVKKLKKKKKYYVRVRAYKKYTDSSGRIRTAYGKWAKTSRKTK